MKSLIALIMLAAPHPWLCGFIFLLALAAVAHRL